MTGPRDTCFLTTTLWNNHCHGVKWVGLCGWVEPYYFTRSPFKLSPCWITLPIVFALIVSIHAGILRKVSSSVEVHVSGRWGCYLHWWWSGGDLMKSNKELWWQYLVAVGYVKVKSNLAGGSANSGKGYTVQAEMFVPFMLLSALSSCSDECVVIDLIGKVNCSLWTEDWCLMASS